MSGYFKRNKGAHAKLHVSGQTSPAAEAALIFFCLLFFYQEKKRRDSFCEKEGMPAKLAGYLKRNKGPPAKLAGYLKRDKEARAKLQETIMRSKKVPGKLLGSRLGALFVLAVSLYLFIRS